VPSGASTGKHEAIELRDNDASFYLGKGVLTACSNVEEEIGEILIGAEVKDQRYIDQLMIYADGTENKMRFGANAILGVSLACARAAAIEADLPLYRYIGGANTFLMPVPMMNVINGGMHADNKLDFQEFMIMPLGASSFTHAMQMGTEIFQHLKSLLKSKNLSTNVGDEGGFAPNLRSNDEAIELLLEAVVKAGYRAGKDIFLAIDAAVSDMYNEKDQLYHFEKSGLKSKSSHEMVEFWSNWANQYPIFSIEDGLA
jgi:enolase